MSESKRTYIVYLAGPITGCNDDQKNRWRKEFKQIVGKRRNDVEFHDPTEWSTDWRPLRETFLLRTVDVVVANMWKESIGTTVGIMQALDLGKPVILIDPCYLNSKILEGLLGDKPARSVQEAADRLIDLLDRTRDVSVQKSTGEVVPFELTKLVASIQTACAAAHIPEDQFANQISRAVLQSLEMSADSERPVPTSAIRGAIFKVLEDYSSNQWYDAEIRRLAAAVKREWEKKEKYKRGDVIFENMKADLTAARAEAEQYKELWMAAARSRKAAPHGDEPSSGSSNLRAPRLRALEEAVRLAEEKWRDSLEILPSAHRSARNYDKWRDADRAFELLDLLGECAFERMVDKSNRRVGPTLDQMLKQRQRGFEYAPTESKETMERYERERTFSGRDGKKWVCKQHLKIGTHGGAERLLRIYFCEDPATGRIVIGHVGEHLTTYTGES
jgi:transcriptional regulator NrdR family protein